MTIWEPFNELKLSQQIEWKKNGQEIKTFIVSKKTFIGKSSSVQNL